MSLSLRDDLHFCLTDRCVVFLDLANNRYFGLTGQSALAFRQIAAGYTLDDTICSVLRPLYAEGIISESDTAIPIKSASIMMPTRSAGCWFARSPDVRAIMIALLLNARIAVALRVCGLKAAVHKRRNRKAAAARSGDWIADEGRMEQVLFAHRRIDRAMGGTDRCLPQSLALIDHLAQYGQYPDLVIGIRTGAFAAHCWVQAGDLVLNDDLDQVRLFSPILVL